MGFLPVKTIVSSRQRYPCIKKVCLIVIFLFFLLQSKVFAEKVPEYQLKATFLVNFLDFTKWPSNKRDNKTICVLGRNPFKNHLKELASFARNSQEVIIKHVATLNDSLDCHILYVSRSETNHLNKILKKVESRPLLTVSDINRFAANSGMIEIASKSSKTKLIINLNAVRLAGIELSSNLIDLAQVVGDQHNGGAGK